MDQSQFECQTSPQSKDTLTMTSGHVDRRQLNQQLNMKQISLSKFASPMNRTSFLQERTHLKLDRKQSSNTPNNQKRVSQGQEQMNLGQNLVEVAEKKRKSDVPKDLNMIADF